MEGLPHEQLGARSQPRGRQGGDPSVRETQRRTPQSQGGVQAPPAGGAAKAKPKKAKAALWWETLEGYTPPSHRPTNFGVGTELKGADGKRTWRVVQEAGESRVNWAPIGIDGKLESAPKKSKRGAPGRVVETEQSVEDGGSGSQDS